MNIRHFSFFTVLLLACLLMQPAWGASKREAQQLIDQHRYAEAAVMLRSLMSQNASLRREADANKLLGQALCMSGSYAEAIPHLEIAIKANKRSGAQWYMAICRQHTYEYDKALNALNTYRPVLKSAVWQERADSLEDLCQIGQRALSHQQDIVIIDSLCVPLKELAGSFRLGAEAGRFVYDNNGDDDDILSHIYFENQARDYRVSTSGDGYLMGRHKIQGAWDEDVALPGVESESFNIVTPFMLTDGGTLYFATDSMPGLGGLDIYKTRYNADEDVFYTPERLGMPFNSPANDFMMAYDELNHVGWWATDRNAPEGMATIYVFIDDEEPTYLDVDDDEALSRARIDRIADTWREGEDYSQLLRAIHEAPQEAAAPVFTQHILVANGVVYHSENEFKSDKARKVYQQSVRLQNEVDALRSKLSDQRKQYAKAPKANRQTLGETILKDERRLLELQALQKEATKEYRQLEAASR